MTRNDAVKIISRIMAVAHWGRDQKKDMLCARLGDSGVLVEATFNVDYGLHTFIFRSPQGRHEIYYTSLFPGALIKELEDKMQAARFEQDEATLVNVAQQLTKGQI